MRSSNSRIQKFTSTGTFLAKRGDVGTADGQFNLPHLLAVDASGNVYVTDTGNNRIQKFARP
jgi:DNA-binding beta-propeller fold protein YncE